MAVGALLMGMSDAVAPLWGHRADWSSPAWWAWQAAVSVVVGMSLGAVAREDAHGMRRPSRAPATAARAWRLHRLAGRLTHEVSDEGMRPDRAIVALGDDVDARKAAYAAQLASPVTTRDALDGEGPEALRLAYVILVLCRSLSVDAARSVALVAQSEGIVRGMEAARKAVRGDEDKAGLLSFFLEFYLDHHAYWETAISSVASELRRDKELDAMLVNHLARTHRAAWLAVTGRDGEPCVECAGIEAHQREETRAAKRLATPHVQDAVQGKPLP